MSSPIATVVRVSAAAMLLAAPSLAGPTEIYGRPLRGLTQIRVSEILRAPGSFGARMIRIGGLLVRTPAGSLAIQDADAALPLETVGFSVPASAVGGRIAAEGRVAAEEKKSPVRLIAAGVEVAR